VDALEVLVVDDDEGITGYADQFFATRPLLRENEAVLMKPVTVGAFLEARRVQARE
jgi:hypothetical protein